MAEEAKTQAVFPEIKPIPGSCVVCGEPTSSANVEYCELCFLMELKKWHPEIEFLKADGTRTEVPEECSRIRGLGLKRRKP